MEKQEIRVDAGHLTISLSTWHKLVDLIRTAQEITGHQFSLENFVVTGEPGNKRPWLEIGDGQPSMRYNQATGLEGPATDAPSIQPVPNIYLSGLEIEPHQSPPEQRSHRR